MASLAIECRLCLVSRLAARTVLVHACVYNFAGLDPARDRATAAAFARGAECSLAEYAPDRGADVGTVPGAAGKQSARGATCPAYTWAACPAICGRGAAFAW